MESRKINENVPTINPKKGFFYSTNFLQQKNNHLKSSTRISTAATSSSRNAKDLLFSKNTISYRFSTENSISHDDAKTISTSTRARPFSALLSRPLTAKIQKNETSFAKKIITKDQEEKKNRNEKKTQDQISEKTLQKAISKINMKEKRFISLGQKIRIRHIKLKLNKSKHIIGYNFLKEFLTENPGDDNEKKMLYLEKIKDHLLGLLYIKETLILNEKHFQDPLFFFNQLDSSFKSFKEGSFLYIYSSFTLARFYCTYEDYYKAISCLKSMETCLIKQTSEEFRLLNYYYQGKNYKGLQMYKESLKYFFLGLQLSWKLHDKNQELSIYDQIGLVYYYLGNISIAKIFHDKMTLGQYESDKEFKKYAISLYNQRILSSNLQNKLDKTFKKALISHINSINSSSNLHMEEKPKMMDHKLNVELKKLELQGKISRPLNKIGEFMQKNNLYFEKRKKKLNWSICQKEPQINSKILLTQTSFNRNFQNFSSVNINQEKFQNISYKSNITNQKFVLKLIKKIKKELNDGLLDLEDFANLIEKDLN